MFEIPSDVPAISEISVKQLSVFGIILDKFIWVSKLTHQFVLQARVKDLNRFLSDLRDRDVSGELWKLEEVQHYMDYCCSVLKIPSVCIGSEQLFNLEQLETTLFLWKIDPDSVHDILSYIWLVLFEVSYGDAERSFESFG